MGAVFVLAGMLLLMMSYIWIVGEALKKDLWLGLLALFFFPVFSPIYTFVADYNRCIMPFSAGVLGLTFAIVGKAIGL